LVLLQEAMVGSVDNGKAYGVCRCGEAGDEREDAPLCKAAEEDPQDMTITCQVGYSLKVALSPPPPPSLFVAELQHESLVTTL